MDESAEPVLDEGGSAGYDALARGAWQEAFACFKKSLQKKTTPEALEGLGQAAHWLDDAEATLEARERAYQLYCERGDRQGAARVATALAWNYNAFRGEPAIANGWVQRARRLLDGLESTAEYGWLLYREGEIALALEHDTSRAQQCGVQAAGLGRSLGLTGLEIVGLALEGLALVSRGEVQAGMRRLDESTVAATAGEVKDINAIGLACCNLIYACERVQDYDRAAQWCQRVKEFCTRWNIPTLFAICRTQYASVLIWRGAWKEAEAELAAAHAGLHPGLLSEAIVRLAEIRRLQGQQEEAERLFVQAGFQPLAQLGRAALALERKDYRLALDLVQRYLRLIPREDRAERAPGLTLLIDVLTASGQSDQAQDALVELQTTAELAATQSLQASARFAEGLIAAALKDHQRAVDCFEDAALILSQCGTPFEAARARMELARSFLELHREGVAVQEARAALETLEGLGAVREAQRAQEMLRQMERKMVPGALGLAPPEERLTHREQEVLQLIAEGLSNQEIAEKLVLSQHTIHRHIANILRKLELSSRAAAAAYAAKRGLI